MIDTTKSSSPSSPFQGIDPQSYSAPHVFHEEMQRIFRFSWLFAGFSDDLSADNDYITTDLASTSVVVQNFSGELRAFQNVCSHRAALIQPETCGNRPMQCPYHGWVYNRDGVPVGIPGNAEFFGLDRTARQERALTRFDVAVRGRFVFVRLEAEGPSLDEYLGRYAEVLDRVSLFYPHRFDQKTLLWTANWKIGIESVLEVYHVDSVHKETFKPFFAKNWDIDCDENHSVGRIDLSDTGRRYWDGIVRHLGLIQDPKRIGYENYLIFPNLAIGITHGAMASVQTYEPMAADRCRLRFHLLMAATGRADGGPAPVRRHVEDSLRAINRQVLEEDREVSESVQVGLTQARRPALLGRNEARIHAFHHARRIGMGETGSGGR